MDIVKKNLVSIICGVIALVALIALVWPIGGMYGDFKADLEKRAKVNNEITALVNQRRLEPIIDPSQNTPVALKSFPNRERIAQGDDFTKKVAASAQEVLTTALDYNRRGHDLLLPGSLPRPDQAAKYAFRTAYNQAIRSTGAATQPSGAGVDPNNIPDGILRAAAPPTEAEIDAALRKEWDDKYVTRIILVGNDAVNKKQIDAEFREDTKDFKNEFRRKRAATFKTYMEPDALTVAQHMEPTATPTTEDMWYAQVALWVQQDAARAIADINGTGPGGILASPVKHVLRIDVPQGSAMYVTATDRVASAEPPPPETPDQPLPQVFAKSPTGRVCSYLYDVVHFEVDVIVDAAAVQRFLQTLEHRRLVTVLEVNMQNVDEKLSKELNYDYGDKPVVRLALKAEALFMRDWTARRPTVTVPGIGPGYVPPMPVEVMRFLGIPEPTPGGDAPPPMAEAR